MAHVLNEIFIAVVAPSNKESCRESDSRQLSHVITVATTYPTSSRIAFFTLVGTGAYFSGSMTDEARPWLIERSSVV